MALMMCDQLKEVCDGLFCLHNGGRNLLPQKWRERLTEAYNEVILDRAYWYRWWSCIGV